MFKFRVFITCWIFSFTAKAQSLINYVNPFIGTGSSTTISSMKHGAGTENLANTIPAVGVPFGMTQWTPQTRLTEKKCVAPFYYNDNKISGFRATHWLSGSCTQDYGSFTIMPITGSLNTLVKDYAADYNHTEEISKPNYYSLTLSDYQVKMEISALTRSAILKITAQKADSLYVLITPNSDESLGFIKIDHQNNQIIGYNPAHRIYQGNGKSAGFSGYFVIEIDRAISTKGTYSENNKYTLDSIHNKKDLGAYLGFKLSEGEKIQLRVGTSFSSIENAKQNLKQEINHWDFSKVEKQSAAEWESQLKKINILEGEEAKKNIFYTAMYHSLQHPRVFNDVDGTYPKFDHHYELAKIEKGNYYDDFSMWDIYRAQLPLLEIISPNIVKDMVNSLLIKGEQATWLPIFPCWNNITGAMIGDHSTSVITSAYLKGIITKEADKAYHLMRKNAFEIPSEEVYLSGKGRRGLTSYLKHGYIPLEDKVLDAFHRREQVSRTLEYAYDDFALAQMAKKLNKFDDYNVLLNRSKNYKNVFDTSIGFARGKYENGTWFKDFNPDVKHTFITEGTSRQYMFYVPQDIEGLSDLIGGKKKFENSLDSLFEKGEYWHGNEPGHHIPFLYNYTSSPWKTQKIIHEILNEEYGQGIGGLSGNDDAGQMSAWYVFAALGFYPVNPVSGEYQITTPIFNKVNLTLSNNKKLNIEVKKPNENSIYIDQIIWNGKVYKKWLFTYNDLLKGGDLKFVLK